MAFVEDFSVAVVHINIVVAWNQDTRSAL